MTEGNKRHSEKHEHRISSGLRSITNIIPKPL